jgi:2-alkyl-3-oxoalkanoate reductase
MTQTIFVLGGTGFIGRRLVGEALAAGLSVKGLARSGASAAALRAAGAHAVEGTVEGGAWARELQGAAALIDLVQPALPRRITRSAIKRIAAQRGTVTTGVIEALRSLPEAERPLLFAVSGADDLEPDEHGIISHRSPLRSEPVGFAHVGVPVRRLIERSHVGAAYVYFGNIVYGAGKIFADVHVAGLRKRRAPVIGDGRNHLPLTHVDDAARALVHLAGLPGAEVAGRTWVVTDGSDTTQGQLLGDTAALMDAKPPRHVPVWLAGLAAGAVAAETMTLDVRTDPSALRETGFQFRYPSHREGVPQVLAELRA